LTSWHKDLSYRLKLVVFFVGAIAVLFALNTAYSALNTISRLNVVEAERDRWQRPSEVVQALDLRPGNVVVDLGCGAGYFALKLSGPIGDRGRVVAEDVRRLPLVFLWLRTVSRRESNVTLVHGALNDPRLPARVNSVLISNTYHEFADSHSILVRVYESLVQTGRLVIVDRTPRPAHGVNVEAGDHEISAGQVERELRDSNFEIVARQDHFIESDPDHESWWLIVARKP
jgi:predicted methyltransferase